MIVTRSSKIATIQPTLMSPTPTVGIFGTGNTTHLSFFKGDPVARIAALRAMLESETAVTNNAGQFMWSPAVLATAGLVAADFLGSFICNESVPRSYDPAARKITLNLSNTTGDVLAAASGTPTYFVARNITQAQTVNTFAGFTYTGAIASTAILFGTVGDETSDAELRILGGTFVSGQHYRLTDLIINM